MGDWPERNAGHDGEHGDHRLLFAAHGTLAAGARFFADLAVRGEPERATPNVAVHARTLGNQLHELEHLLGVLADEASPLIAASHDASAFARLRSVPKKLRLLGPAIGFENAHYDRAEAIGRLQRKLRHGARPISHTGVCHPDATPPAPGKTAFPLSAQAMIGIGTFYCEVGERLMTQVLQSHPSLTFPPQGHI